MTENIHSLQEKSIVLIGFMGVGKTTIAKLLAEKLNRPFFDIDEEIEKELKMPTAEIFKQYGEAFFRKKEKETVLQFCKQPLKVISLGGGAFLQDEIKNACLQHSIVIYLDITWEAWKERLDLLIETRPVLQNKSIEEVKQLFNERKAIYAEHDAKVVTDGLSPNEVANQVIDTIMLT